MNTRQTRLALLGLALGVLLALLIAPQTRWLVRLQTLTALRLYHPLASTSYTLSATNDMHLYQASAARHPDDFLIQYGHAEMVHADDNTLRSDAGMEIHPPDFEHAVLNLRELTRHFPNNPVSYANILRYETLSLHWDRTDDYLLTGEPVPSYLSHISAPSPDALAAYDQEAASGERIDPDNAYFPLMRAYGLFAGHHDAEALAAVQRASVKPFWREYLTDDDEAQWRLHSIAFNDPSALAQTSVIYSQLFPHYTRLRAVARLVANQAVLKEQAGHPEDGLALREALCRCGDLMRVQSTPLIGSLVGIAISAIAQTRPGGIPYAKYPANLPPEQMAQRRLETYCTYVTQIGHPEAAQRARDEEAARLSVQTSAQAAPLQDFARPFRDLIQWWQADIALLLNVGWLLVLGLIAAGLNRRRPATEKPPLDWKAAVTHLALALSPWLLLALFFVFVINVWNYSFVTSFWNYNTAYFGLLGAFGLLLWGAGRTLRQMSDSQRWAVLRTAALLPMLWGILYGLYWIVEWQAGSLAEITDSLQTVMGLSSNENSNDVQAIIFRLSVLASLAVPMLLALVFSAIALLRRVSVSRALAFGFGSLALPIACLLLTVYGGLLLGTARQERLVTELNHHIVYEGGRYFAARAGQPWPGPVR